MSLERIANSLEEIARVLKSLSAAQGAARKPAAVDTRTPDEKWRDERDQAMDLDRQLQYLGAPNLMRYAVAQQLAQRGAGLSRRTLIGAVPLASGIGNVRASVWFAWIDERFPPSENER